MSMKLRVFLSSISLVMLATIALVGCGHYVCGTTFGSSTCTPSGKGLGSGGNISQTALVYFMDDAAGEMAAEGLNLAGSQAFLTVPNFATPPFPRPITDYGLVTVGEKFLYMPLSNQTLYGFTIDTVTGALTPVSSTQYTVLAPSSIAADPKGAVLFVGGSAGISAFTIDPTLGTLTLTGSYSTGIAPSQIVTDGLGRYVYALSGSSIYAFSYTSGGVLTALGNPISSQGMAQIAGEASGNYIIGITAEDGAGGGVVDNHLYVFTIGSGGAPVSPAVSYLTGNSPVYLAVSPNGKFVYTFNELIVQTLATAQPIEGYALIGGVPTALGSSPFTNFTMTIGKFDQSGQYLFTQGSVSGVGGSWALSADPAAGGLTSTIAHLSAPSVSFAVTDVPQ
jgi:6-phosphogluconolactonase (cycloisomerase 2 family)